MIIRWVLMAVALATLAATAAVEAYQRLDAFSGEVCIATGRSERVAVRQAMPSRLPFRVVDNGLQPLVSRDLSVEDIPFEDAETARPLLDRAQRYDAVRLPFSIRLKHVSVLNEFAPCEFLKISEGGVEKIFDLAREKQIQLAESAVFEVSETRKWSGLLRNPNGEPMAAISVRADKGAQPLAWTEYVFLPANAWRRIGSDIAIRFRWYDSADAARKASLPGLDSARWGVVDGPAVNWFQTFLPGTGAQLSNGASVTFVRIDESAQPPFIEVRVDEVGKTRTERALANEDKGLQPFVRFEYLARLDRVFLLNAANDNEADLFVYRQGQLCGQTHLLAGDAYADPRCCAYELRLDEVLAAAVPVPLKDSTLYEAVIHSPTRDIRVRQGEAVRYGDALIEYIRKADPSRVRYELEVTADGAKRARAFTIGPDGSFRFQDWRFAQGTPGPDPLRTAVLRAEFAPKHSGNRLAMAGALAALVWLAILSRHSEKPPESR